ncbi:hypothetical protein ABZ192_34140 [Streptomyces sp. NPDC006235]|jgi:hypothetical protein|uniref:hypothetical protein n=1 Tax=Streptomyces sp. NPDC006235 TaxID=3156736 RepID=UPI00339F663B
MSREQRVAEFQAQQDAADAAWERELEWRQTSRRLDALYDAQTAGDRSTYTQQRIARLEAVQAALCGFPEQLAA